jgi:hypothetical protein
MPGNTGCSVPKLRQSYVQVRNGKRLQLRDKCNIEYCQPHNCHLSCCQRKVRGRKLQRLRLVLPVWATMQTQKTGVLWQHRHHQCTGENGVWRSRKLGRYSKQLDQRKVGPRLQCNVRTYDLTGETYKNPALKLGSRFPHASAHAHPRRFKHKAGTDVEHARIHLNTGAQLLGRRLHIASQTHTSTRTFVSTQGYNSRTKNLIERTQKTCSSWVWLN